MKANSKMLFTRGALLLVLVAGMGLLEITIVPEADAAFGARRRTAIVTAAVVKDQDAKAAQDQQPAPEQTAPASQPAQAATPAGGALPNGTVVAALPTGCKTEAVDNVTYYQCSANRYRAAFQGSQLVYVTVQP